MEDASAPAVRIEPVADIGPWLTLCARLYAEDRRWVPPLGVWVHRRTKPWLRDGALRLFVARRGERVVGHVSALRGARHGAVGGEPVGFFGFFDCEDDEDVARALLEQSAACAREWGLTRLRGPRNLSRVEEVGVLAEGFDRPQPMLAAHGQPYYPGLLEALGFEAHHEVLAYDIELDDAHGNPKPLPERLRAKAEAVDIPGLSVRPARRWALRRDLNLAHRVFVDAFRDVPENTPMPRGQFVSLALPGILMSDRRMLQLAEVGGAAAGFALCFPELNEALVRAGGEALPLGWARALLGLRRVRTASFKLIGVLPEHKGTGLHALMIARAIEGVRAAGYARLEASLVDARNGASRGVVEGAGMEVYRRYRIYERPVR